jgi:hypothetical protein
VCLLKIEQFSGNWFMGIADSAHFLRVCKALNSHFIGVEEGKNVRSLSENHEILIGESLKYIRASVF